MRLLILIILAALKILIAKHIEIEALKVTYSGDNQVIKLDGEVLIKDDVNFINTQKAIIKLKNNQLISYRAYDKVKFFYKKPNKSYNIQADSISFDAKTSEFKLLGSILIKDDTDNEITANKIVINQKTNKFDIEGNNQPVRLHFKVEQ